ncbi:MAG: hypothetical protein M5U28_56260 [Sandaracinaceae bacterium]|nr:hypothetical protein [Sandaracinaceae bacterium]
MTPSRVEARAEVERGRRPRRELERAREGLGGLVEAALLGQLPRALELRARLCDARVLGRDLARDRLRRGDRRAAREEGRDQS